MADQDNKKNSEIWWQQPLAMFGEMSAWIAFPVIISLFLGKWLDQKFNTSPWLFFITIGAAFLVSMFGIAQKAIKSMKEIDNLSTKKDEDRNKQ